MIKIEVTKEHLENINGPVATDLQMKTLPESRNMNSLIPIYQNSLKAASDAKIETLYIPPIPSGPKSTMFQAIHIIYQCILDYASVNDTSLKKVCILCDTDSVYNLYMVVWNLYYAKTKTERMNDGRWD